MSLPPPIDFNNSHNRSSNELGEIPIVRSVYLAYAYWNELLLKFPKSQRYTLGTKCAECILEILELVMTAAEHIDKTEKAKHLHSVNVKLDILKLLVRLCKNCKCISNNAYLQMESQLQEIGRMLGGWLRSLK
ncbi:MAG: diversity-generating retroelement protein Avd [Patescibacteria group bacterium]